MPEETNQPQNDPFSIEGDAFAEQPLDPAQDAAAPQEEESLDLYGAPKAQGGLPDMPDAAPTGNRPAEGARQVMPGEVLATDFQGSETAGDFLGLDVEFTGAQPSLDLAGAPQTAPAAPDHSELMQHDAASEYAEGIVGEGFDEGYEDFGDEEFGAEGFDEEFEDPFADVEQQGGRSPLVLGGIVAVLAAVGVVFVPKFLGGEAPVDPIGNVAKGPAPVQPTPVQPDSTVEPAPEVSPDETPSTDPGTDPFANPTVAENTETPTLAPDDVEASNPEDILDGFGEDALSGLLELNGGPDKPSIDPSVASSVGIAADLSELPDFVEGEFSWVSEDKLDMVWRGQNVPMDAIFAPARIVTPRVGSVRVHMNSGEILDGRLYAVGLERVWLDLAPGRIGLDGHEIVKFEHLAVPPEGQNFSVTQPAPTQGDRVRVRTAGGVLYGRVISFEGDTLRLQRDDGGRITLEGATVEPIGSGRAIVVQR